MECFFCDNEWTVKWMDADNVEVMICKTCASSKLLEHSAVIYKWILYSHNNPNVTTCSSCWWYVHKEQKAINSWRCINCEARYRWLRYGRDATEYFYCHDCDAIHRKGMCPTGLTDEVQSSHSLSFTVSNQNKSWNPKWDARVSNYIKKIWQFQTERELRDSDKKLLEKFYRHWKKFSHYYTREPVDISGEVTYYNYNIVTKIYEKLDAIRYNFKQDVEEAVKISKYYNYYLKWLDENWLVKWQFIDLMWNVRERSESINKFFQDVWMQSDNSNMFCKFKYRLSSDINHKIDAFKLNERVWSCQKSGNCDSYARWAYDAITNWCNCPLLIYTTDDKPIARITTRIMYDEQWQEYILIDRIYHSWEFSDLIMKWEIYKAIVKDLKNQWYKVIASPYSAHDRSTYAYLNSLWMKEEWVVRDLCQPLRWLVWSFWYYCDWWTEVLKGDIDWITWATDFLDKAYLF